MLKHLAVVAAVAVAACASPQQAVVYSEMGVVDATAAGWKTPELAAAINRVGTQKSTGFVIVQKNRIIAE